MGVFKKIAKKRINYLFDLAKKSDDFEFSDECVSLARRISLKHKASFSKEQSLSFCKKCSSFLVLGHNVGVRVKKKRIIYSCKCGFVRRFNFK
ncbi:MAG: ribonuclease P protein component 4 [Candidatus Woesearchaeota archaeon]